MTESADFGAHTFGFVFDRDVEATVDALAGAGFRQIEIMATPPHYDPWNVSRERQRRLRAAIARAGLELLALDLASSDVNLASLAPQAVDFAVDAYCKLAERAAELGTAAICVGSGRRHPLLTSANARLMESFEPAFVRICEAARKNGVRVWIENMPAGLLPDAGSLAAFVADHDGVGVIYDVANAFAIGEDPAEGLARLADAVRVVHFSDAPRGSWRHDPIGSGDIDFLPALTAARIHAPHAAKLIEILSEQPFEDVVEGRKTLSRLGRGTDASR